MARNKSSRHPDELYSKRKEVIEFFEKRARNEFLNSTMKCIG